MNKHKFYLPPFKLLTPGNMALIMLMIAGLIVAVYRFWLGLGATTNLSDQYPWGIWVAFDVVCGVALAAGGFTTAAVVYIFWGEKYHGLVRPAVLTGFLGYVFVAIGLIVDLGIPWHIYHPIIFWPKHSALFEVAWCVMLYTSVLALEFLPSVFERFGWERAQVWFEKLTPIFVVLALSWFAYVMSQNWMWAGIALVVLTILAIFLPRLVSRSSGVPILLIIAGVLFSTAHQSSLGTLFLLTPDKLHPLWWTPMLPVDFFISAVAVGFAMVIFESTLSSRNYGLPIEEDALEGLGKILIYVLGIYLAIRFTDLIVRGSIMELHGSMGALFLVEICLGVVIPFMILVVPRMRAQTWMRFTAAALVIFGLIFNRFNVTIFAMERPGDGGYFPSPEELLISAALVSAIIFFYNIMVRLFPVLPDLEGEHADSQDPPESEPKLTGGAV